MKAFPLLSRATPLWAVMLLAALLAGCQGISTTGTTRAPDVIDIGEPDVTVEQPGPRDDQPTADQARVPREIPFPEDVYAKLPKSGSAVLSGRLTLNTDAGPVIGAQRDRLARSHHQVFRRSGGPGAGRPCGGTRRSAGAGVHPHHAN